jgi:hypothetical protein
MARIASPALFKKLTRAQTMARTCGFCGGPGVNKEHVWPDWIRKIILAERRAPGKTFEVQHEHRGEVKQFKTASLETLISMPCGKCNSGWMSELENAVKPFMAGMIHPGQKTLLDADRRLLLARWATKTAMVFEFFKEKKLHYFTPAARNEFMSSALPAPDVSVWLGRYWAMKPMHALQDRKQDEKSRCVALYSFTMTAQFFAMQVAARRGPSKRIPVTNLPDGALLKIWPDKFAPRELAHWPPPLTMGEDGLRAVDTRFRDGERRDVSGEDYEV